MASIHNGFSYWTRLLAMNRVGMNSAGSWQWLDKVYSLLLYPIRALGHHAARAWTGWKRISSMGDAIQLDLPGTWQGMVWLITHIV